MSKTEDLIAKYLDKHQIKYEKEYSFDDCELKNLLRFDFAIFKNGKLFCLIEYNDYTHYKNTYAQLENFWLRNDIKSLYCIKNNLPLLRIPYMCNTPKKIIKILKKYIVKEEGFIPEPYLCGFEDRAERILSKHSSNIIYQEKRKPDVFDLMHIDDITELFLEGKLDDVCNSIDRMGDNLYDIYKS